MKKTLEKPTEEISIDQIKKLLEKISPKGFCDKIIISDSQRVIKSDYIFVKFKYQKIVRKIKKIRFPLYDNTMVAFSDFEGGLNKFGDKSQIKSDRLFEVLKKNYQIKIVDIDSSVIDSPFNYPLDTINDEINPIQEKYFLPEYTYQEICGECNGSKYIVCRQKKCRGRHEYTCPGCYGNRKLDCKKCDRAGYMTCSKCRGQGEYKCSECKGKGEIKCGMLFGCGGSGFIKESSRSNSREVRCRKCNGRGYSPCKECRNGIIRCAKCFAKGEIRCDYCSGRGEIDCRECNASGNVICDKCYGDKDRYGMVDCPQCKRVGVMAQVVYVESIVSDNETEYIIFKGDKLDVPEISLLKHCDRNILGEFFYKNINDVLTCNHDDISKACSDKIEKKLGLNRGFFPLVTKEEVSYQFITCIESSYKHILTNSDHQFRINNFWSNPEVIFSGDPEQLKNAGDALKVVLGFFGKLFGTQSYRSKNEKLKEIVLLIYLLKSNSHIKDQVKICLSKIAGGLSDFTNSEKKKIFDLINAKRLPVITKEDVFYSSEERIQEVVSKLTEMSNSVDEIKSLPKFNNFIEIESKPTSLNLFDWNIYQIGKSAEVSNIASLSSNPLGMEGVADNPSGEKNSNEKQKQEGYKLDTCLLKIIAYIVAALFICYLLFRLSKMILSWIIEQISVVLP